MFEKYVLPLHQIPKEIKNVFGYKMRYPCFMVSFLNDLEGPHREMRSFFYIPTIYSENSCKSQDFSLHLQSYRPKQRGN